MIDVPKVHHASIAVLWLAFALYSVYDIDLGRIPGPDCCIERYRLDMCICHFSIMRVKAAQNCSMGSVPIHQRK